MTTNLIPGSFAWAIAQAGAGNAIRRASWPFYWFLTPVSCGDDPPEMVLCYTATVADDGPLGSCQVGHRLLHPIPTEDNATPNGRWVPMILATDWETCPAELPFTVRRGPPRLRDGEALLILAPTNIQAIDAIPEHLPGFRKVVAFIPEVS